MLVRLIESLLINTFNGWRRGRELRAQAKPPSALPVPPDHIVIGQVIPQQELPASEAIAHRLLKSGLIALSLEARRRHLYILGATGTGKTNLLLQLIEHDIRHKRAFCVIDLRGDLVDRILLRLAQSAPPAAWSKRLLLIDLRQEEWVTGFNPLQGEGDDYNRAFHVLSVLKQQSDSWGVQLEETLRNSLIALAQSGLSLLEIEPLLTEARFRQEVMAQVSDSRVKSFFARFDALAAATQLAWALAVINKVTPLLAIPQLRLMFGQRDTFSFRTLLDQEPGMIILISLAVDRLHEAARLTGGLFVSAIEAAIMARADQPEGERVPAHLYVDEFEAMATDRFETFIAEGRRFGLGLCLSHQNISQLSTGLRQALRNNVHTQVYFQTGALDAAELAKEISSSESKEDIRNALITQGVGEAYLVRRGQRSLRLRTKHCPDPHVNPEAVEAVRQASFLTYAQRWADLETELAEREQCLGQSDCTAAAATPPTYTIRHDKLTRFSPHGNSDGGSADGPAQLQPNPADPTETVNPPMNDPAVGGKPKSNDLPKGESRRSSVKGTRGQRQNSADQESSSDDETVRITGARTRKTPVKRGVPQEVQYKGGEPINHATEAKPRKRRSTTSQPPTEQSDAGEPENPPGDNPGQPASRGGPEPPQ